MRQAAVFGQYWAASSFVHRMDPRVKMLLSVAIMAVVFCARWWLALLVSGAFLACFYAAARVPLSQALRSVAPLAFLVVFTALFNVLFVQDGEVYFQWWVICVSEGGLARAAFAACRLFLLLMSASLLTLTTATLDITEAFERLLMPLRRVGLPAHELGMMMGIALRFLPQFVGEFKTIYRAQVSRGATLSANPVKGGGGSLLSLVVPLFTSAFRRAETLSGAMDARCYHGGVGRTKLRPPVLTYRDALGALAVACMLICVLLANVML